jgi:hypothetical protein
VRVSAEERGLIFDRVAQLVPPPPRMTRQAFIDRDEGAFDSWTASLGLGDAKRWWVHWKDAL